MRVDRQIYGALKSDGENPGCEIAKREEPPASHDFDDRQSGLSEHTSSGFET